MLVDRKLDAYSDKKNVVVLDVPKADDHIHMKSRKFSESYILHEHLFVVDAAVVGAVPSTVVGDAAITVNLALRLLQPQPLLPQPPRRDDPSKRGATCHA